LLPSEIGRADLMWHLPFLQHALFASYGVDYEYVAKLCAGSPATEHPGGITIVYGNDHTHERPGFDAHTVAPWTVVMPRTRRRLSSRPPCQHTCQRARVRHREPDRSGFYDDTAGSSTVGRYERGTMHPKLHLLCAQPTPRPCYTYAWTV
jgi:hypothetical protein